MISMDKQLPITETEFENLKVGGMEVNYFAVCQRKMWLYAHRLQMESSSDRVSLGKLLHETAYPRTSKKEVLIDSLIKVDIIEGSGKVVEVKHSQQMKRASRIQVLYYLYYLKHRGLTGLSGELRFPKHRRIEAVGLTDEGEQKVESVLREVENTRQLTVPPASEWKGTCRYCAYAEFCWG